MKNLYKRTDIFRCVHESHKGYKNNISVYHILKEKSCYPDGCIYFRWRCKQLNKRSKCHRGYSHVGRKCFGCRDFFDEKIHNYPELQISAESYREFLKELDEFEDWIEEYKYRPIEFWGKIFAIKPHFIQKIFHKSRYLSFRGFMMVIRDGYLGNEHIEDPFYVNISSRYYRKLNIGVDGEIEGRGQLRLDKGRLVLNQVKNIDVIHPGKSPYWNEQRVMVSRETAVEFQEQPENCVQCPFGSLVELHYHYNHADTAPRRRLFCLKGISSHKDCFVPVEYCGLDIESNDCFSENPTVSGKLKHSI